MQQGFFLELRNCLWLWLSWGLAVLAVTTNVHKVKDGPPWHNFKYAAQLCVKRMSVTRRMSATNKSFPLFFPQALLKAMSFVFSTIIVLFNVISALWDWTRAFSRGGSSFLLLYHKSKEANVSKAESGMLYHGMDEEASTWHSSVVLVARVKTACLVRLVCITSNHFK